MNLAEEIIKPIFEEYSNIKKAFGSNNTIEVVKNDIQHIQLYIFKIIISGHKIIVLYKSRLNNMIYDSEEIFDLHDPESIPKTQDIIRKVIETIY